MRMERVLQRIGHGVDANCAHSASPDAVLPEAPRFCRCAARRGCSLAGRDARCAERSPDTGRDLEKSVVLARQSQTRGDEVREATKNATRFRVTLPTEVMAVLRWHADRLPCGAMRDSDPLIPSETGGFRKPHRPRQAVQGRLPAPLARKETDRPAVLAKLKCPLLPARCCSLVRRMAKELVTMSRTERPHGCPRSAAQSRFRAPPP
jgi:hypothetical protein